MLCTASLEERVPPWLRGRGRVATAEYGMLPRATGERMRRSQRPQAIGPHGKSSAHGRSLRAVVDMKALGENQISLDCDVIQADGGTRTASITGAWVALHDCIEDARAAWFPARY